MLAHLGKVFDSNNHLYEIKWDGMRTVAYIERGTARLVTRRRNEISDQYPELNFLSQLPTGLILDGEIVVLTEGKPDFQLLQKRIHASNKARIAGLAISTPTVYIVFDLLYRNFDSCMDKPLQERRKYLAEVVPGAKNPRLILSEAIIGSGNLLFEAASERELEGIVAKRLDGRYLPGKRTRSWIKIKRVLHFACAVIGYIPKEGEDFASLVLASDIDGTLRYVGNVGTGISEAQRAELWNLLSQRVTEKPLIDCPIEARWIEPALYCSVSCNERTRQGILRAPVFENLILE
jgi:DNA ligase D-like protein (predicted ligase)